jgi:hypothetical protein
MWTGVFTNTTTTSTVSPSNGCPTATPFWNGQACVACYLPQYWNNTDNKCEFCTSGQNYDISVNQCRVCPQGTSYSFTTYKCQ